MVLLETASWLLWASQVMTIPLKKEPTHPSVKVEAEPPAGSFHSPVSLRRAAKLLTHCVRDGVDRVNELYERMRASGIETDPPKGTWKLGFFRGRTKRYYG
jgi:hypothetical protein